MSTQKIKMWLEEVLQAQSTRGNFDRFGSAFFRIRHDGAVTGMLLEAKKRMSGEDVAAIEGCKATQSITMKFEKERGKRYRSACLPEANTPAFSHADVTEEGQLICVVL